MKRLLALLVALAIGWVTMPAAASASLVEHGRPLAYTYTYDLPGYDAPDNDSAQERGPPSVAVANTTAVDLWSHGTLARPDGVKAPSITTYAYPVAPAQAARATTMTGAQVVLADGDLLSVPSAQDAAEDASTVGRIGYHATKPEFAPAIREGGFRQSAGGRLGGGGVYVSHDPETALAEYAFHNPGGPAAELLRVRYNPGEEFVFDGAPAAPYVKGIMPPEWADTLTAPSLRNPGGWNSLVRGPLELLP